MTDAAMPKRLYRSRVNRMIGGVCGGVAEYFDIDPAIVRIIWVLSVFLGGTGILLYVAAIIVVPTNPVQKVSAGTGNLSRNIWAWLLVIVGGILLAHNLDVAPMFSWWGALSWKLIAAVLLIILGGSVLLAHFRRTPEPAQFGPGGTERPRLHRSVRERKILGVCGGLSDYFDVDPTVVRLVFILIAVSSLGFGLLLYVLLALAVPEERLNVTSA